MLKITMADTTYLKCGSGPISFLISGYFSEDMQGREEGRGEGREEEGREEEGGRKRGVQLVHYFLKSMTHTPKTTYTSYNNRVKYY